MDKPKPAAAADAGSEARPAKVIDSIQKEYREWIKDFSPRSKRIRAIAFTEIVVSVKSIPMILFYLATIGSVLFMTGLNYVFMVWVGLWGPPGWAPSTFLYSYITYIPIMIMVTGIMGSKLVADDFQNGAISLYLCRPISRIDYLVAKILSLSIILFLLTMLPMFALYFAGLYVYADSGLFVWNNLWVLGAIMLEGFLIIFVFSSVGISLSAVIKKRWWAFSAIFILLIFSILMAEIMISITQNEYYGLLSVVRNLLQIGAPIFGVEPQLDVPWPFSAGILAVIIGLCWGGMMWRMTGGNVEVGQ